MLNKKGAMFGLDARIANSDGEFKGKVIMYKNPDVILNIIYSPYKTN